MKRLIQGCSILVFVSLIASNHAHAAITNAVYNFDEFGHGNITLNGADQGTFGATLSPDTTLGGLANWNVLTYTLPFAGFQGDVLVRDPAIDGSPIMDVLRFDGNFHLIVYSDSLNGIVDPADTPGPPNPFYSNLLFTDKQHPSVILGFADFTPAYGEPGSDAGLSLPSYHFLDPGVVPEPGTASLILMALGVLGVARRRAKAISSS